MIATMIIYWIAMGGLFISYAYTKGWILTGFESIEAKEAISLLKKDNNITVLDVRTNREYNNKHLKNAIHIPVQVLSKELDKLENDKNKRILVYCKSGNRSITASRILEKNGFTPINVNGGIIQLILNDAQLVR
jgi:rhodanese-related sulfurtransferase